MIHISTSFEAYDFWSPLSILTITGMLMAFFNAAITRRLGSSWDVWFYAVMHALLGFALAFGYVLISEVGDIPRLGQLVTYGAVNLLLLMRVVVTLKHAGPLKAFMSDIKPDCVKPLDKIPDSALKSISPQAAVAQAIKSADDSPSPSAPVV